MGATVVRSHTLGKYCQARVLPKFYDHNGSLYCLGISTGVGDYHTYHMGWNGTLWPQLQTPVEDNFASLDYSLYMAGQLGLKLIVPLTDNWNYYHGG